MHPMCFLQKTHRDIAVGFQMAAHEVVRTLCLGLDVGSSEKLHQGGAVSLYGKNRLDRLWNYSFRRIDVISPNVYLFFGYIFIGVSESSLLCSNIHVFSGDATTILSLTIISA